MLGLPPTTELRKQIPKTAVYAKLNLPPEQRKLLEADISRLDIVALIAPRTIPAIPPGESVKEIYVVAVKLRERNYNPKSITRLSALIPQKIVFALHAGSEIRLAVNHTQLIVSGWIPSDEAEIPLTGLNLDSVWANIVRDIGQIDVAAGSTLTEQIDADSRHRKILAQIAALERKLANEKQPRRKREYFKQLNDLKAQCKN